MQSADGKIGYQYAMAKMQVAMREKGLNRLQ